MKRARERARAEKQKEKAARRFARSQQTEGPRGETARAPGVDPDIAHIRVGPQEKQDWQIDPEEVKE
jgi:hypothetical protein